MMAMEQILSEAITKAVAEASYPGYGRAQVERTHNTSGPKIGGPAMKQPTFDWDTGDTYSELKHSN